MSINVIITPDLVNARIKHINEETPLIWTNMWKSPQELTVRTTARNNLMIEQVLLNQMLLMQNQNKIMEKIGLGNNVNTIA